MTSSDSVGRTQRRWCHVKRVLLILLAVAVIGGVTTLGEPVAANTVPPPGLSPRGWACYTTCVLPNYIVADDFNMDGWMDLAVSCIGNNVVDVYTNAGNGLFPLPVAFAVNPGPTALITWNTGIYDGLPDIGVLSTLTVGSPAVPVTQIPNGIAPPVDVSTPGLPQTGLVHMAGGYFDNNNLLDIAVVSTAGGNNLYVFSSAGPQLTPGPGGGAPILLPGIPVFVTSADFDQNGWLDIAVLCLGAPATVTVYYNNGISSRAVCSSPLQQVLPPCCVCHLSQQAWM